MRIRKAHIDEIETIDLIYENARKYMCTHGNPTQWIHGYPSKDIIKHDILDGGMYVVEIMNAIEGVFYFQKGPDSTYDKIENGHWLNEKQYEVVHRVASAMNKKRMGDLIIQYCQSKSDNIRIDTHVDNRPMQNMLERNGFRHVGTIYLEDGSPRMAYHWYKHCNMNQN